MGKRGRLVELWKELYNPLVLWRDGYRCVLCDEKAVDVHEIISKSQFATHELGQCITPKNMVSLCRKHHAEVQGNKKASANLLRLLRDRYGYEYKEQPFKWYIEEE